jgi:hypothetical protein
MTVGRIKDIVFAFELFSRILSMLSHLVWQFSFIAVTWHRYFMIAVSDFDTRRGCDDSLMNYRECHESQVGINP